MAIRRFNISSREPALNPDGTFTLFWYNAWNRIAEFAGGTFVQSVGASSPLSSTGGDTPVISLNDSPVTPGAYGDATHYPTFTVSSKGLLQAAGEIKIVVGTQYMPVFVGGLAVASGDVLLAIPWEVPTS